MRDERGKSEQRNVPNARGTRNAGPNGRKEGRRSWQPGIYNSDYGVYGDNLVNSVAFIFP